jgi:hypothetical protein
MNIYCVKGVAAYHEFASAMRAVCAIVPEGTIAHTARIAHANSWYAAAPFTQYMFMFYKLFYKWF